MRLLLPTDRSEGIPADRHGRATEFRKGVSDATLPEYLPRDPAARIIVQPRRPDAGLTPVH